MVASVRKSSFTGGEWSPSLHSRPELAKYDTAVKRMKNFIIKPHGPASNRGGTEFVGETKDSSKTSRLVPFQFSVEQSYILEFGDQYMRVYKDGGVVLNTPKAITNVTQSGSTTWVSCTAHGVSPGDTVYIYGVVGITGINDRYHSVSATSGPNSYAIGATSGTYVSGGFSEALYEIATPWVEADLELLKFEQSADVLYVTHPSYAPRKISRTGHTAWTLSTITFASAQAAPTGFSRSSGSGTGHDYCVTAVSDNGEESVISNVSTNNGPGDTWTWTPPAGVDFYNVYKGVKGTGYYGWIGRAINASYTEDAAGVTADYTKSPPQATNPFSGADNYPGVSTFFEQRLLFARTNNAPQTLWGSKTGNFENMDVSYPVQEDDSYEFTINARRVNEIRWMVPLETLIVGTAGAEWRMTGGGESAVTPTNVNMKRQSQWGVSHIQPLVIGNTVLFIEGSNKSVRDLLYSFEIDGYAGNSLTILATHLFKEHTIKEWAYQQAPDSIIWVVRSDGTLLGLTYYREHEVWGWHQHETDGWFESVANITVDEGVDETWFIVRRFVDGVQRRYIERFRNRLPTEDVRDSYFVDCGLSYDVPLPITGATQANPVVITCAAHGLTTGDLVDISDVTGMTELNLNRYKVGGTTTNTFELQMEAGGNVDGTNYTEYIEGGNARKTVTTLSGFRHLEGMPITILANGNEVTGKTVVDGSFTLDHPASRIHAGLGYEAEMELLDFVYPVEDGTTQDRLREIKSVLVQLEDSRVLEVGPDEDHLVKVPFRDTERYGDPIALFTGDKEVSILAGAPRTSGLIVRNTHPVPITVSAIIARMEHGTR